MEIQNYTKAQLIETVNAEVQRFSNIDFPLVAAMIDVGSQWNALRVRRNKETGKFLYGLMSLPFAEAQQEAGRTLDSRAVLFDATTNISLGLERLSRLRGSSANEDEAVLKYFSGAKQTTFRVTSIVPIYRRAKMIAPTAAGIISMGATENFGILNKGMASMALLGVIFMTMTTVNLAFGTVEKARAKR